MAIVQAPSLREVSNEGRATNDTRTTDTRTTETRATRDGGTTTISDQVVAKIAGIAAREVDGVQELVPQGIGGTLSGLANKVSGGETHDQGVKVQVGQQETIIDLAMVVRYGMSIPRVAEAVRTSVSEQILSMTGLKAREINIAVTDVAFPETKPVAAATHELK